MTDVKGCAKCHYTGFLHVDEDDTRVQQCICSYAKTLKAYLGPEIASAPTITRSPFYELAGKGQPPKVDRTRDNLFIKSYWTDLLPHLKWTLACKGPLFRYRVVTDEKLKTVYVGDDSYKLKAKSIRDGITTYNSIGDLVGPEIDLIILRLGFLGYKNVAMPGVLKEALMLREAAGKPTWLIELPTTLFGPGHFSYNEDVASYIDRIFEVVRIEEGKRPIELPQEDQDGVGLGPRSPDPEMRERPRAMPPKVEEEDMGRLFEGSSKKAKFGKKRSGGGPV